MFASYTPKLLTTLLSLLALNGCYIHSAKTHSKEYISTNIPNCPTPPVSLTTPIVGTFIGINEYKSTSGEPSKPAHTLGAAFMYDLFASMSHAGRETSVTTSQSRDLLWTIVSSKNQQPLGPTHKLSLLTDLRETPNSEVSRTILEVVNPFYQVNLVRGGGLRHTNELIRDYNQYFDPPLNKDGTWTYLGGNSPIGLKILQDAISETIKESINSEARHGSAYLVLYIAAHGTSDDSGTDYLILADSLKGNPSTWISKKSIISQIESEFLKEGGSEHSNRRALLIFDNCRTGFASKNAPPQKTEKYSKNLSVIHTTSLGDYAWHYSTTTTTSGEYEVDSEIRIGIDRPEAAFRGKKNTTSSPKMSVFPLAARCAMSALSLSIYQAKNNKNSYPIAITITNWLDWTSRTMTYFTSKMSNTLSEPVNQSMDANIDESEKFHPFQLQYISKK